MFYLIIQSTSKCFLKHFDFFYTWWLYSTNQRVLQKSIFYFLQSCFIFPFSEQVQNNASGVTEASVNQRISRKFQDCRRKSRNTVINIFRLSLIISDNILRQPLGAFPIAKTTCVQSVCVLCSVFIMCILVSLFFYNEHLFYHIWLESYPSY